jgi:hypothetical protein
MMIRRGAAMMIAKRTRVGFMVVSIAHLTIRQDGVRADGGPSSAFFQQSQQSQQVTVATVAANQWQLFTLWKEPIDFSPSWIAPLVLIRHWPSVIIRQCYGSVLSVCLMVKKTARACAVAIQAVSFVCKNC